MKKEDLWAKYVDKNPKFNEPDAQIIISGRGLRKLFDTTYDAAHDQGFRNGKAKAEMDTPKDPLGEMLDKLFGGKL